MVHQQSLVVQKKESLKACTILALQVLRVMYDGQNTPHGGAGRAYYDRMLCSEVVGTLT